MGRCNSCGAIVKVPERIAKVCFICGKDVTHLKHTKDLDNNYLCMDCWENRNPAQRASFNIPTVECSICHATFAEGEGFERDGEPICRDCNRVLDKDKKSKADAPSMAEASLFAGAESPFGAKAGGSSGGAVVAEVPAPTTKVDTLDDLVKIREPRKKLDEDDEDLEESQSKMPSKWEPLSVIGDREFPTPKLAATNGPVVVQSVRGGAWSALLAVAAICVSVYAVFAHRDGRQTWEQANAARLYILKAQGDVLVDAGRADRGIEKYHELLKAVNGKTIRDPDIRTLIRETQIAADQAASLVVDPWEDQNRTRLLVLRAEGNILVAVGKYREGIDRYTEMIRMSAGRVLSREMNEDIRQAQLALQQARIEQQKAENAAKPPVIPPPNHVPPVEPPPKPPVKVVAPPPNNAPGTQEVTPVPADPPQKIRPNIFDTPPDKPELKPTKPPTRKSVFD